MSSKIFAQVLLPIAIDRLFSYLTEGNVKIGDVVKVEFGRRKVWGVVFQLSSEIPEKISEGQVKNIIEINSYLRVSRKQIEFIEIIASYNLVSRGLILRAVIGILNSDKIKKLPQGKKQEIKIEKFSLKKLSYEQQKICDEISTNNLPVSLIDGVTGSGKTEIYFGIIKKILCNNNDSQILILLPEIALTSQLVLRFKEQFGFEPALWHSKISKKEKREIFYGIVQGSVRVVIGARSSLLMPFKSLQMIVVDEEHDSSFKQEDVFNFHARDMAIVKAKLEGFSVILCSATPSIETYNNAILGKYYHFILEQKFGIKNDVELVDLRREKLRKGNFLSQKLCSEIKENLAKKKQVLLFLNRRGYAPVTLCKSCGKKYECSDCDFHLVLHKLQNKLVCHHCGYKELLHQECKFCGEKDSLISLGIGVEKVKEEVEALFSDARSVLLTSDDVGSFIDAERAVKEILNNEVDIIIGTQMIAKGYDFPNLALVGVIDADGMLYSSDLRASERVFQMLTQVIGRAGRRDVGKVIIQTYNPQNLIFEKIIKDNKKDFYDFEIEHRRILDLPPFSKWACFEISSFFESDAKNFAKKLVQSFPVSEKIEILGPAPAPIQRLKNRHHFLVNLKVQKRVNLQKLILDVMQALKLPTKIRVRINIDPVN